MENIAAKILSYVDSNNLLVVPKVLLDLMEEIQRENVDIDYLAKLIGQDASLSSKILAAANSPFYRQCGAVNNLNRVLVVLGLTTVKTMLISVAVQQFFAKIPQTQQNLLELIWYRSFTCAHTARKLAELTAYPLPDEAYLTGLLHRLGQLILLAYFANDYADFLMQHFDELDEEVETQKFGVTFTAVGGHLITGWQLQSFMADAVRYQRLPLESLRESASLVSIVNLASQLSSLTDQNCQHILAQAGKVFGLHQGLLEDMLKEVQVRVKETSGSLGIKISNPDQMELEYEAIQDQRDSQHELLGQYVKKIALTAVVQQAIARPTEMTLLMGIIQRDLAVMFGFRGVAIFLFQLDRQRLEHVAGRAKQDTLWSTLAINPDSNSLLAKAWSKKRILHSFNTDKSTLDVLIDRQICQLLAVEDLLAIPMVNGGKIVGVIAAGLKLSDVKRIKLNLDFINLYIEEATKSVITLKASLADSVSEVQQFRAEYQLEAHKLLHEVNNPLTLINNYLHLLELKTGESFANELRIIQEEIVRVGNILLRLPDLAQDDPNNVNWVDLNALIMDLLKLFEAGGFTTQIVVKVALESGLERIPTDRNKLKQILTNLLKNAFEAMPFGGDFSISTQDNAWHNGKKFVEISLIDSGPGLPDEIKENIYRPVMSTKGKQHSGLGLTISKNLIEELNGFIHCNSAKTGTQFRLLLPKENKEIYSKEIQLNAL